MVGGWGGAAATQFPFWCSSDVDVVPYNTVLLTGMDNLRNNILTSDTSHALRKVQRSEGGSYGDSSGNVNVTPIIW